MFSDSIASSGPMECRCMRHLLHSLLSPVAHALSMLVISLGALLAAGDLIARLENHGLRGRNDTLSYAADMLRNGSLTDEERLRLLREWSTKTRWNTEEGVYYTFSLFSTVGFGKYSAATSPGRIISAIFIVLFVPIGVLYVQCLSSIYQSMLSRLLVGCRQRFGVYERLKRLVFPSGDATITVIPVTLLTLLMQLHLLLGVMFLCVMEQWTPMQSLYFLISATTTIGFGDLHTGPHSLSYVLAYVTFQLHLCALFMQIINYLNDALEWILQLLFSRTGDDRQASGRESVDRAPSKALEADRRSEIELDDGSESHLS